jgi:hypothetical protein
MFAQLKSKASSILSAANSRRYRRSLFSREIDFVELCEMIRTAFPTTLVTLTNIYPTNGAQYRLACRGLTDCATGNQVLLDLEVHPESLVIARKLHYVEKGRLKPFELNMIYKDGAFQLHLKQNREERIIPEVDFPTEKLDELTDRLFEYQARRFLS